MKTASRVVLGLMVLSVPIVTMVRCNSNPSQAEPEATPPDPVPPLEDETLIGGRPANPAEWPASVYASMSGARCTATLVGEKVLFIAAHCVSNGGAASFSVGANRYNSTCTHSADYRGNSTADYALCLVERAVTGIKFESVNIDNSLVRVGDEILLTGYGCVQPGGGGGNDGIYRIGEAKVTTVPSGSSNDIVARGGAALCFGDSGGPAFKYLDAGKTKRVLISINSRGDIRTTSYLSSVSTTIAKRFITAWQARSPGIKICGVNEDAANCRGGSNPIPPPDGKCKAEIVELSRAKSVLDIAFDKVLQCVSQ